MQTMQMKSRTKSLAGPHAGTIGAIMGPAAFAAALLLGAASAGAASAEKGKAAFVQHGCWQCHGYQGQGGVTGFKLAPDPIPFETLSAFVRTTNRNMPPYREDILSNDDLADIYAYLQSIPKGPDPASIPLLNE
jgi:mono/diheme cytochrome c family protein